MYTAVLQLCSTFVVRVHLGQNLESREMYICTHSLNLSCVSYAACKQYLPGKGQRLSKKSLITEYLSKYVCMYVNHGCGKREAHINWS